MFCLNEEDEEDDLLETITGRVCFIHFLSKFILAHQESLQKWDYFFFLSPRILVFSDTFLLAPRV